jgi:hypothetical protein
MSFEIRKSEQVTTRRICFIRETCEAFEGLEDLTLVEYCGLGRLHDKLLDSITDMELIIECVNCYLVEHTAFEGAVFHALHSDDEQAFKSELRNKILSHVSKLKVVL